MTTTPTTPDASLETNPNAPCWADWSRRAALSFIRRNQNQSQPQAGDAAMSIATTNSSPEADSARREIAPAHGALAGNQDPNFPGDARISPPKIAPANSRLCATGTGQIPPLRHEKASRAKFLDHAKSTAPARSTSPRPGDQVMTIDPSAEPIDAESAQRETAPTHGALARNPDPISTGDTRPTRRDFDPWKTRQYALARQQNPPLRLENGCGEKSVILAADPADQPVPEIAGRTPRLCMYPVVILAGIGEHYRARIYAEFRKLGGDKKKLNDRTRHLLSEAIYKVEDDLEYKDSNHPQVKAMRQVRNWLYDDIGVNTYPPWKVITDLPPAGAPKPIRPHNRKAAVELKPADPIDTTDQTGATP